MSEPSRVKVWAGQIRAPFLILSVFLVLVGTAAAYLEGHAHWLHALLCGIGVTLAHIAVNLFNEHSDSQTGIDENTKRTPFSGGSGTIQAGHNTPRAVLAAAVGTLLGALAIGLYLTYVSGWPLLAFILAGGVASVIYTSHLARWALGELAAGLCLGSLVVLGTFFVLTGGQLTVPAVVLSIPPGLLTALLLFLNEFPDLEADREGGRKHLVIRLGRRRAAVLYAVLMLATFLVIVGGAASGLLPLWTLLGLLTLPLALKAVVTTLKQHESFEGMLPALGANVMTVLGTDLMLAVGLFVAALTQNGASC